MDLPEKGAAMDKRHPCLSCERQCLHQFVPDEELVRNVDFIEYDSGETIIKQGKKIQNRYVLCEGYVKVGSSNSKGKKAVFSLLSDPEIIEKSCLHSNRDHYPINAVAATDVTVSVIAVDEFQRMVKKHAGLSDYITEEISRELDFQLQKAAMNSWAGSRENLIWLLLSLYQKLDHGGKSNEPLDLHMSENDLAGMLGVSRETVVIHLSSLKKQGLARATRGSVIVTDYDGLVQLKDNM